MKIDKRTPGLTSIKVGITLFWIGCALLAITWMLDVDTEKNGGVSGILFLLGAPIAFVGGVGVIVGLVRRRRRLNADSAKEERGADAP